MSLFLVINFGKKQMALVEIDDKIIEDVLEDFEEFFREKINSKGRISFNSRCEIYGKLTEEQYEALKEVHKKDDTRLASELADIAATAIFGIMSLRANGKI